MIADAAWTQPVDVAPVAAVTRLVAAPGLHVGWIEGRATFARVTAGGAVRRRALKRPWRTAGFDARGRALTVTTVTSRRPCRGKRSYRVYVEVRRDGGRTQRLGDGCRNIGAPVLAVNPRGRAVLAWLEIPGGGAKKRLVVAEGSTTSSMRAVLNSGEGDAGGHAVAMAANGRAVVAYRRGSRMLAHVRPAAGRFGPAQDLGPTPQRDTPATAAAIDDTGAATVAWTEKCSCGEAGMTSAPNPLRAARSAPDGRFGAAQTLDPGRDVVRPPQVAAARGVSAVLWRTEDASGSFAAVAPAGAPFGAADAFPEEGLALTVDREGTPMLATGSTALRRAPDGWAREAVPAGGYAVALFADLDGRTALVTQDGARLRVSYR